MSNSPKRQMALVGFMQAGNATVYAGSWRHPATEHGFLTASYYQKLARTLEQGVSTSSSTTTVWPCPASTAGRWQRRCVPEHGR